MRDKYQITEEPCEGKLSCTVLKTSGAGDSLAEFNTFLTVSDGSKIESPQFLKQSLNAIKKAGRQHSKKQKGSSRWERARLNLVRNHEDVTNRRSDWFWKLAHELTDMI